MRQVIKFLLCFYPAEHRAVFASEMLCTFEQAAIDSRKRGLGPFMGFAISECMGLFRGLLLEWIAKWTAQGRYLVSCRALREQDEPPTMIVEAQARLQQVIGCMVTCNCASQFPGRPPLLRSGARHTHATPAINVILWLNEVDMASRKSSNRFRRLLRLLRGEAGPQDPYARVRVRIKKGPGGRSAAVALKEPDE